MQPLERTNLVDQTEAALLAGIRSGHWKGSLPGVRMLCKHLQISSPTLKLATNRLLQQGALVSNGPRRRFEISPDFFKRSRQRTGKAAPLEKTRRVVCLSDDDLPQMTHSRLQILSHLRIVTMHWSFRHHIVSSTQATGYHKQWDRLADVEQPDAMIVFGGRSAIAKWSHERNIPTIFVGGDPGEHILPVIGMNPLGPVSESLATLIQHGHRDVCMPMLGLFKRLEEAQRDSFRAKLEEAGIPFDASWNTPSAMQRDPDVLINILNRICRVRVPTAIIAMSWAELVAILSFLQQRGLSVPQDVSVISLAISPSGFWFRPKVTHFEYAVGKIAKTIRRWIDQDFPAPDSKFIAPAHMFRGESVAKPKV